MDQTNGWDIVFDPSLPANLIIVLALIGAAVIAYSAWRGARGAFWRATAFVIALIAVLNPTMRQEDRDPVNDVAVVLIDKSQSMDIGSKRYRNPHCNSDRRARRTAGSGRRHDGLLRA